MAKDRLPKQYVKLQKEFPELMDAVKNLGQAARKGPLDEKSVQLIQLAAAVAIRSEGAAHSHTRRALQAGATPEQVRHAVVCLTSTLGFPQVSAALSLVEDVLEGEGEK